MYFSICILISLLLRSYNGSYDNDLIMGEFNTHLNYTRNQMPQLYEPILSEYLNTLKQQNVTVELTMINTTQLLPTQREFFYNKIKSCDNNFPILISKSQYQNVTKHYIFDGHHRTLSCYGKNISSYVIYKDIFELIDHYNNYLITI